jgi:hypothetical protein
MNNTYRGDFTQEDIDTLESFFGYTFWKVDDDWNRSGYKVYAKHESWNNSQRTTADSVQSMFMSLHINRMAG